jgi:hypothetical protein
MSVNEGSTVRLVQSGLVWFDLDGNSFWHLPRVLDPFTRAFPGGE